MKTVLICLAVMVGQVAVGQMVTLQDKPIVHLQPHSAGIRVEFSGRLLELIGAPDVVYLPASAPVRNVQGTSWSIDIKNLGPNAVVVVDKGHFRVRIMVGETVHIRSDGTSYSLK